MSEGLPLRNPRHLARTFAVLGVYQWLTNGTCPADIELQLPDILRDARGDEPLEIDDEDFARCDRELFVELLNGAIGDAEGVSALFEAHTDRAAKMLSPVERAILMVGTVELRSHPENPYPVVINEAVELAKDFGGTNGYRYVNGVLDKLAAQLRPDEVAAAAARRKGRGCGRKAKAGPA